VNQEETEIAMDTSTAPTSPTTEGPVAGEVEDVGAAAEKFLELLSGDPEVASCAIADVLDAAAELIDESDQAEEAIVSGVDDQLDPSARAVLEALASAASRRRRIEDALSFSEWILVVGGPDSDPMLRQMLLSADDEGSWRTFRDYHDGLCALAAAGSITDDDLTRFRRELWPQYLADVGGMVDGMTDDRATVVSGWGGLSAAMAEERAASRRLSDSDISDDGSCTTVVCQYGVDVVWSDGRRETIPETSPGVSRLEAEQSLRRAELFYSGRPVLMSRRSIHGPWTEVR
jgi:hypothetical protein